MECYISLEYNTLLSLFLKCYFFFFPETPPFLTCSHWRHFPSDSRSHAYLSLSPSKSHVYLPVTPSALSANTQTSSAPSVSPVLSPDYPLPCTHPWLPVSQVAPAHPPEHWICVSSLSQTPKADFQSV